MCDGTSDSPDAPVDVVRAGRFELVDDGGEVRAVLGNLALESDDDYFPGLTLRSAYGQDRVTLLVHPGGPDLEFWAAGNAVAVLGVVDEHHHAGAPGPRLVLCDEYGQVAFGWRVSPDGEVEALGPGS